MFRDQSLNYQAFQSGLPCRSPTDWFSLSLINVVYLPYSLQSLYGNLEKRVIRNEMKEWRDILVVYNSLWIVNWLGDK